jgi:probable F420-dependent oxidoreductase
LCQGTPACRRDHEAIGVHERMSLDATPVRLGKVGVFAVRWELNGERAAGIEKLGYGAIWIGGSPAAELEIVAELLEATSTIAIATGIVNIWSADAATVADSYHRLEAAHPGRFLLGIGAGHPEVNTPYTKPYQALVDYLDVLEEKGVPKQRLALAALGPRVLKLAAERTSGAHPYLVSTEYTRGARETLGDAPLLAVEHKVALGNPDNTDGAETLAIGRAAVDNPYLHLANYRANLRRLGYSDADLDNGGTDALIDALVARGDAATVAAKVCAHLTAGADHVALHVLPDANDPLPTLTALAAALHLG